MTKHLLLKFLALTLALILTLPLVGCGRENLFAYQEGAQSHTIRYENEGGTYTCRLALGEGGIDRDFSLAYEESDTTPAYTIGRTEGVFWLQYSTKQVPISAPPIPMAIVALFCIPAGVDVTDIHKEGDIRVVTCVFDTTIYTLHFEGKGVFPTYISAENKDFFAIYVN